MRVLNKHMIPKSNFRTHYPRFARASGPPVKLSTIREESKHQCLKQIANGCKSRINISKTLSLGQALKNYDYISKNIANRAELLVGPTVLVDSNSINCFHQIGSQINPPILSARYKPEEILPIIDDDAPVFFCIIDIFLNQSLIDIFKPTK